jgi:hypothetical protein
MSNDLRNQAANAADAAKDNANRAVNSAEAKANSSPAIRTAEDVVHKSSTLLQGQIPDSDIAMGHPIHPSTVHFPIAVRCLCSSDLLLADSTSSCRPPLG